VTVADSVRDAHRRQQVIGALLGWVVGDALGAPFEFGPAGAFSRRFPTPMRGLQTEVCGGGPWRPGEWTDDSQMGLAVGDSLLTCAALNEADVFERFQAWLSSNPKDVGNQTRAVLGSGCAWDVAAHRRPQRGGRDREGAGNTAVNRPVEHKLRRSARKVRLPRGGAACPARARSSWVGRRIERRAS
jgi:ADP-ribosyl-[dinitrogen reductase] hydrolase